MNSEKILLAVLGAGVWALVLKPVAPHAEAVAPPVMLASAEAPKSGWPGAGAVQSGPPVHLAQAQQLASDDIVFAPTGDSLTETVAGRVMQFASREALKTYVTGNRAGWHRDGDLFQVGRLTWRWQQGADEISDLRNLVPEGLTVSTSHFASDKEAFAWGSRRNIYVEMASDPGHFRIGRVEGGGFNKNAADGVLSYNVKVTDSARAVKGGKGPQKSRALTAQMIVDDEEARGGYVAGHFSTTVRNGVSYPDRLGGIGSWSVARIDGTDDGKVWGAYATAQFSQKNKNAESDGKLVGIEIGAKNWGGSDVANPYEPKAKIGIWFAQGGDPDAVDPQPSTAMIVNGNSKNTGWHYGIAWRNISDDYLWFHQPIKGSQARALNISNSEDWASEVIVLPNGAGIGSYDASGEKVTGVLDSERLNVGTAVQVAGTQVVASQQPAIADSAGGDEQARINAILAALRAHGLIAQ